MTKTKYQTSLEQNSSSSLFSFTDQKLFFMLDQDTGISIVRLLTYAVVV